MLITMLQNSWSRPRGSNIRGRLGHEDRIGLSTHLICGQICLVKLAVPSTCEFNSCILPAHLVVCIAGQPFPHYHFLEENTSVLAHRPLMLILDGLRPTHFPTPTCHNKNDKQNSLLGAMVCNLQLYMMIPFVGTNLLEGLCAIRNMSTCFINEKSYLGGFECKLKICGFFWEVCSAVSMLLIPFINGQVPCSYC